MLKVALVKSVFDVYGPWKSVKYGDPLKDVWPGKASRLSTTHALQADWYVTARTKRSRYFDTIKAQYKQLLDQYAETVDSIPFEDYDVVISTNAILDPPEMPTVFAYFRCEHWDSLVPRSPGQAGYDLLLGRYRAGPMQLNNLPARIALPITQLGKAKLRTKKREQVWVDWREGYDQPHIKGTAVAERGPMFADDYPPYGIHNPPLWGDAWGYLDKLSECKYYIASTKRQGPGQAAVEAAREGCLCIGQDRINHQRVCHPKMLARDFAGAVRKLQELSGNIDLQKEVLAYQEQALHGLFYRKPLEILARAVELKREMV